ncbi:MAG TPA: MnmC family methyltransferase [Anaerolineae bacterium]|nr:MnmC family methyltransferase [Anaerolineae bacterium]
MNQYRERLGQGEERVFTVEETLYQGQTAFQHVDIIRATGYGRVLFLNGERQSSEADEFIYHEMLVHPTLFRHPAPRRIFLAGGGEGAVSREILKHTSVETITQVDIDGQLIELCRQYLPAWSQGAYEDPRLHLIIGDALAHLRQTDERYDIIFLDLPEWSPDTPARELYTPEFYALVRQRLSPGGLMALQVGPVHPVHLAPFINVAQRVRAAFAHVILYPVTELRWGFGICADAPPPAGLFDAARLAAPLRYYNAQLHAELGALPTYIQQAL